VTGTIASISDGAVMTTTGNLLTLTANAATTTTGLLTMNATGLTTGRALNTTLGSALTSGGFLSVSGASYAHAAETGSLVSLSFTDATTAAVTSTTNGLLISPTISAPSGAATRTINGISVNPSFTACAAGTCAVNGLNVGTITEGVDAARFASVGLNIGTGWDTGINAGTMTIENIGNTGTDFIASTGALTLAGILTANGGASLTGGQSFTAGALAYMDLGAIVHNTTAVQGLRLPQAASATPSNPISGEGYLAWDATGNQLITYNGSAWTTLSGGSGYATIKDETTPLTARSTLAFLGTGVSCSDNGSQTECTISGSAADLQGTYDADANGGNVTISLTAADDGLVITNPSSGGNDLSAFTMQVNQQNTTAAVTTLDLVQFSNAANGVDITANAIDGETGLSITTNGLTSGKGLSVTSSATAFTGNLAGVTLSGSNVANTGNVFAISNTGTLNTNVTLFVDHRATGTNNLAVRVDDVAGDTTPFVIDGSGQVGVGTAAPSRAMDIFQTASAPQLRLSKDLTNYSEFTVDSAGDLEMHATGNDIRALTDNIWVCDGGACPALTLTGQGNIFVENVLKFGNGVYMKNDSATELGVYDANDQAMLVFDQL
jgi:hypothetical protein